ncbi:NTP transferase domain-containing protein [Magnetospira sp. QH-2]|uniref:NTP transferase domain-containing protein n=1 Tax=Magnetospira sp. (strain QH-2) TaxID=1288970 RepID=UPI0003E80B17|nr:molybdopterin-binding/glycosyltransferase family 2 protein [Magnetospira sp. QH-2]CCQ75117.1 Conserved protein of unknown function[Include probable molybdopterin binding domain] [Magnetospira sp. QH-2]
MKFGSFPLAEAEGLILAHSLRLIDFSFKKGRLLSKEDISRLEKAGLTHVGAARLDPGDMRENAAAEAVARALAGAGLSLAPSQAGRCNVLAARHGLCQVDGATIDAVNRLNTGVVISTLAPDRVVGAGQVVATVKVIPYAVAEADVTTLCARLDAGRAMMVHPFQPLRVGLILTEIQGTKASLVNKAASAISGRVETYGSHLYRQVQTPHDVVAVAEAIGDCQRDGAQLILILGGASAVDRGDVVPAAIEASGAILDLFGVPLDPGNLLAAGRLEDVPVIGLPGCARSPSLNGVDLILPRLLSRLDLSAEVLLGMGVGGLLKDIPERPDPRIRHEPAETSTLAVTALVLAAGSSRRMGEINKLVAPMDGRPLLRHGLETLQKSRIEEILVVTGFEADRVRAAVADMDLRFIHNPRFMEGLSTSLKAGVRALPTDGGGVLVMLGDMPRLRPHTIDALMARFTEREGRDICLPTFQGRRGNPVLWPRPFFPDIMELSGDVGARHLITRFAEHVVEVPVDDPGIVIDVDRPADLKQSEDH